MIASEHRPAACPASRRRARPWLLLALAAVALVIAPASGAFAGQAATGELFFHPCTNCHGKPASAVPNDFKGHKIVLESHDKLGRENAACLACHDDPAKDPGKLKTIDGSLIDIKGDVTLVCYRCHSAKYREWKAGTHGRHEPSCTSAGCHDPHTPGYIYAEPLLPFIGAGFQFKVLPEREPFSPLAPPAPAPTPVTPTWFAVLAVLGVASAVGIASRLVPGRQKR